MQPVQSTMRQVPTTMYVPENIYRDYEMGNVKFEGVARSTQNGRIIKHLDASIKSNNASNSMNFFADIPSIMINALAFSIGQMIFSNVTRNKKSKVLEKN